MSGPTVDCPPSAAATSPRRRRRLGRIVGLACRYVLAASFLIAAVGKITDLPGFRDYLTVHAGLSPAIAFGVASVLPWLELTCGLCLLCGLATREAAALTAVLLVVFLVHGLIHPVESDCGCGLWPARLAPPPGRAWLLARNLVLLACALLTAANRSPRE
jgi:uncharacterized membrane protein YphA (DoxX/SURF4 family)